MDAIEELLPAYALNALSEEDALRVEDALDREPRYRRLLAEHLEGVGRLAASHAAALPSAAIRERLMERVRGGAAPAPGPSSPQLSPASGEGAFGVPRRALQGLAAALAVAVIGAAGFMVAQQFSGEAGSGPVVAVPVPPTEPAPAAGSSDRQELEELSDTISRPGVDIAQLRPIPLPSPAEPEQEDAGTPAGIVAVDNRDDSVLVTMRLPRLDHARTYQAWWWDRAGRPAMAAVFSVDEGGYARTRLAGNARRMQSLTVNVEPAGGAEAPSYDVVLAGLLPDSAPDDQ